MRVDMSRLTIFWINIEMNQPFTCPPATGRWNSFRKIAHQVTSFGVELFRGISVIIH